MIVVFDIGGSRTRVGISKDGENISGEPIIFNTPDYYKQGVIEIQNAIKELVGNNKVDVICGGIAGAANEEHILTWSPNLKGWVGANLIFELKRIFLDAEVYVGNDTELIGLGEAKRGAGKGFSIVAYITVSTGVGGAKIVDGKIDKRVYGFEPGHQIMDYQTGLTLEKLVGGRGISEKYGIEPKKITDQKVWREAERVLAMGIHNTILHWSPEVIVFGGPMMRDIKIAGVRSNLVKLPEVFAKIPEMKMFELGDHAGLIGALEYLKQIKGQN